MSGAYTAAAMVGGALIGGYMQKEGAENAAETQAGAARDASGLQYRQFAETKELLNPYVAAGTGALGGYAPYQAVGAGGLAGIQQYATGGGQAYGQIANLLGLGGVASQQESINALQQSPYYTSQLKAGEEAMLQNAAATGGLRGGNVQNALMQYRPTLLSNTIQQQLANLTGISNLGIQSNQALANYGQSATQNLAMLGGNAAAGVGTAGQTMGTNVGNLMGQAAAANAQAQIASANAYGNIGGSIARAGGLYYSQPASSGLSGNQNAFMKYTANMTPDQVAAAGASWTNAGMF